MDFTIHRKMCKATVAFLVFYLIFTRRECASQETNRCMWKETCGKCIQEHIDCAWCGKEDNAMKNTSRCGLITNLRENCASDLISPNNRLDRIEDNKLIPGANLFQIRPQKLSLKLRPNSPETFMLNFRLPTDYPVDLYYVMDNSFTMLDDKENLANLSETLATEMRKLTSNFSLGFGSFVDKVATPFVNMHPNAPLHENGIEFTRAYSFRNHMSLSPNDKDFTQKVRDLQISANVDKPEGTLEAVMQAVVCQKQIGWRKDSTKLLVVATDDIFHYAGDGKIGGTVKPNDGRCHLDDDGYYRTATERDYPSVSQLHRKIEENNINLIFAVPSRVRRTYWLLSNRLYGSRTAELARDSSNIVYLIKEQYNAISSTVRMTENVRWSDNIQVTYRSTCADGKDQERRECTGIKPGGMVSYAVTIRFSRCPENRKAWNQTIEIHPVGIDKKMVVDLEMICECDCPTTPEQDQKFCTGRGKYECGICVCDNSYGTTCECEVNGNQTSEDDSGCKMPNEDRLCSGRGYCQCGKCECHRRPNSQEKITGNFCECSNYECGRKNNVFCSGHGWCECGVCKCHRGWKGDDCECQDSVENCVGDPSAGICSGHGECHCGICKCTESYYGKFCDDCFSCPGKCDEYGLCVLCDPPVPEANETRRCESCNSTILNITYVDELKVNESLREKSCVIADSKDCRIFFKYGVADNNPVIYVQRTRECPIPLNAVAISSGIAGGIVFVGLLTLLICKLATAAYDKREFARFQQDLKDAKWDGGGNPIFIEPSTTYRNPAYDT